MKLAPTKDVEPERNSLILTSHLAIMKQISDKAH